MNKVTGRRLKAFTLLELTIVIAIIAVLTTIAVPAIMSMIRDSKTNSSNDTAQQVYMATQDYLISLQISGKNAADYFGTADSTGVSYIGCVNGTDVTKNTNANSKKIRTIHFSEDSTPHPEIKGGVTGANSAIAVNEILNRLPADFKGAWAVEIYPATYTVKCAYYSGVEGTDHGYNWAGVDAVKGDGNRFTSINDQEAAMNNSSSAKRDVGQYPFIPATK